jgi:hypothetical protein
MNTQVPEFRSSNTVVAGRLRLAAGVATLLAGCGRQTPPAAAREPPGLSVVTVRAQSVLISSELPGRVAAYRSAAVRPQVNGIILKRLFVEGSEVEAGEPETLALYGKPYNSHLTGYALLLGVPWANGGGRPAVRHAVVDWDARRIGVAVGSGAIAAVPICALGVARYGALAAAAGSLTGALILNSRAILSALGNRVRRRSGN